MFFFAMKKKNGPSDVESHVEQIVQVICGAAPDLIVSRSNEVYMYGVLHVLHSLMCSQWFLCKIAAAARTYSVCGIDSPVRLMPHHGLDRLTMPI